MKCVFALVVLLHLCYSVNSNMALNREIIRRLEKLNILSVKGNKVNFTSPDTVRVPSPDMNRNASSCLGVVIRELKHLLNNLTVHEDSKNVPQELRANLQALGSHHESVDCHMTQNNSRLPFKLYANFFRKLNNSKKR